MAVFAALGRTLGDHAVSTIFCFLGDTSVMTNCGSGARDVADLNDVEPYILQESNHYWSTQLLDLDRSRIYWHLRDIGQISGL